MVVTAPRKISGHRNNLPYRVNLAAWYRYRIGVTNISGLASAWADQSGNMRPLVQATVTNRPSINSDGSLTFDGSDNYMQAAFTLIQPVTVYLAFQPLSHTDNDVLFDGATGTMTLSQDTVSGAYDSNAGSALAYAGTFPVGGKSVAACVFNGNSSVVQGGAGGAAVTSSGAAGANNPGGITLGSSRTPGSYANITVFEMAVYSVAHDATQRLQTLRYFSRIAQVGGI